MDRIILHCDMNAFYASVELLSLPELAGKPVAVCGNPEHRHGIILAKNEEAKAFHVKTAETVWQAKRKCPDLILVPPHRERYARYSKKINEIYKRFTDMVEPFSIDESWLDVTGSTSLFGSGKAMGDRIRETVKAELGLTLSVGVSFNKIFAKMGSDYKKPDATTVISRDNYRKILWPMPAGSLFSVGKATADKLTALGIHTIGDLARADRGMLCAALGKMGGIICDYAAGRDDSPVALASDERAYKSVGNGITFKRDLLGEQDARRAVISLSDTVAGRLRKYGMKCGGVKVDIKDTGFRVISRQKQLAMPTHLAEEIALAAMELIRSSWNLSLPIRMLTVTGINLSGEGDEQQLTLFDQDEKMRERAEKAERAMDVIRDRFGGSAITYGGVVNNDLGIEILEEE